MAAVNQAASAAMAMQNVATHAANVLAAKQQAKQVYFAPYVCMHLLLLVSIFAIFFVGASCCWRDFRLLLPSLPPL